MKTEIKMPRNKNTLFVYYLFDDAVRKYGELKRKNM
jgi:hypothetical protein